MQTTQGWVKYVYFSRSDQDRLEREGDSMNVIRSITGEVATCKFDKLAAAKSAEFIKNNGKCPERLEYSARGTKCVNF